ncbi:60S ribosomal protein L39 [Colletotrichum higginsianum IMI 349063]|uniref:Large ribosomal subunit protein eL39 n=1 Tax=Colletotrichum higginsianum (strain IMI 349063) TaxID=759273 RepID=A0A1B7YNW8_COLHI|nr:60S ribosomal protein L39 [Colletotrichum higginsianum IMI 349063]OBR13713.1 60S ribosomal protein L39 [Colletotrichum higginsianum IMI 349063]
MDFERKPATETNGETTHIITIEEGGGLLPTKKHFIPGSRTLTFLSRIQSHKTFRTKQKLAKAQKQNRPIPQWIRLRTGNTIRYNAKRRHWRKSKLGI